MSDSNKDVYTKAELALSYSPISFYGVEGIYEGTGFSKKELYEHAPKFLKEALTQEAEKSLGAKGRKVAKNAPILAPGFVKKKEEPLEVRVEKYGNRYGIDTDMIMKHQDKMRNMILAENRIRPEDTDSSFDDDVVDDSGNDSSGSWEKFMEISKGNVIRRKKVKEKEVAKPKTLEEKIHEAYWNKIAESKALLTEEDVKTFQETGTIPRFHPKPPPKSKKSAKKNAKDLRKFAKTSGNRFDKLRKSRNMAKRGKTIVKTVGADCYTNDELLDPGFWGMSSDYVVDPSQIVVEDLEVYLKRHNIPMDDPELPVKDAFELALRKQAQEWETKKHLRNPKDTLFLVVYDWKAEEQRAKTEAFMRKMSEVDKQCREKNMDPEETKQAMLKSLFPPGTSPDAITLLEGPEADLIRDRCDRAWKVDLEQAKHFQQTTIIGGNEDETSPPPPQVRARDISPAVIRELPPEEPTSSTQPPPAQGDAKEQQPHEVSGKSTEVKKPSVRPKKKTPQDGAKSNVPVVEYDMSSSRAPDLSEDGKFRVLNSDKEFGDIFSEKAVEQIAGNKPEKKKKEMTFPPGLIPQVIAAVADFGEGNMLELLTDALRSENEEKKRQQKENKRIQKIAEKAINSGPKKKPKTGVKGPEKRPMETPETPTSPPTEGAQNPVEHQKSSDKDDSDLDPNFGLNSGSFGFEI